MGDEDDGRVEVEQRLLEPLERFDVEVVGGLVEEQQVGLRGQRPGQRGARELAAGERSQGAVEVVVDEAEAMDDRARPLAPAVAADGLEARLHAGVAVHGLLVAGGHRELQALELGLELQRLAGARENVFPEAEVALARRALVVEGDARALREDELAAVDGGLSGQHPQQGRLARAVAPGDGHALAALELERDAAQQGLAGHVLGEIGSDEDRHTPMVGCAAMRSGLAALIVLLALAGPAAAAETVTTIAGAPGPGPSKYDKVFVTKFGPQSAKRVLLLMPGYYGGAGDFTLDAREIVKRVPGLQVWAFDRRSQALEDTSRFADALAGRITVQQAFDYYLGWLANPAIQPHYQPLDPAKFAFAKQWGLSLAMQDVRRVVLSARRQGKRM